MDEKHAELLFTKYANSIIKQLGNKPLYNDVIEKWGKKNIPHFGGVYSSDRIPPKAGTYIINTGSSKSRGIHWIALVRTSKSDYLYDSYSRPIKQILKKYTGRGKKLYESDRKDIEQDDNIPSQRDICGQLSLSWLCVMRDLGLNKALLI